MSAALFCTHTDLYFLQIFTESLLCSNDVSKISLAGDLLTVTPSPASPRSPSPPTRTESPVNHFHYSLSYDTSLELVHNAAKEYFNSAQSFMDDDMDLARCAWCLAVNLVLVCLGPMVECACIVCVCVCVCVCVKMLTIMCESLCN